MVKTDQIYINKLNKKNTHKNKYPSKKWLGKMETKIESQKMKQTCGNISQLPKIPCLGSSPNIAPSSKPIRIHHENRKPRKKSKKTQREKRTQYEKVWILKHYFLSLIKTWNLNRSKRGRRRRRISVQIIEQMKKGLKFGSKRRRRKGDRR